MFSLAVKMVHLMPDHAKSAWLPVLTLAPDPSFLAMQTQRLKALGSLWHPELHSWLWTHPCPRSHRHLESKPAENGYSSHTFLFSKMYVFERQKRQIFHLQFHLQSDCNGQGWAKPKPGASPGSPFMWVEGTQHLAYFVPLFPGH